MEQQEEVKKQAIKLYNNKSSQLKVQIKNTLSLTTNKAEIFSCQIDQDDQFLATGCGDGIARIYTFHNAKLNQQVQCNNFSHGKYEENPTTCIKWKPKVIQKKQKEKEEEETGIKMINNFMTVSTDGSFKEWSLQMSRCVFQKTPDYENQLFACDYNKYGSQFATAGKDAYIRLYDETTQDLVAEMKGSQEMSGHSNRVQSVKFDPNNEKFLVTGGWDNCLILYDLRTNLPAINIIGPHMCGDAIDINLKDNIIMTGSYVPTNPIQFWDLRNTKSCTSIIDWNGGLRDPKDNSWVVNHEEDYKLHLDKFGKGQAFLYSVVYNFDQSLVIAGGGTGSNEVRVFDANNGKLLSNIYELPMSVLSVDSAKLSNSFAFGCSDSILRICSIKNRTNLDVEEEDQ